GFDETVELHINTIDGSVSGRMMLPHGTGKKARVAIASDELIEQLEKGTIDFDVLIAHPSMMPKLAKVAKFLGPRGLMPNPKSGTITDKPEEAMKKFEEGQINFKTEKSPIVHLSVGKLSFGPDKLSENIEAAIEAINKAKIRNAILKSTMSPGIKLLI
ncbi:MAG: 50S ribosomal protein L1, partial [Patescibacteria group bacterium]